MGIGKPEFTYTAFRWNSPTCWLEIRVQEYGAVTGHYASFDKMTYHNTGAPLKEKDCCMLAVRALGLGHAKIDDLAEELWNAATTLKTIQKEHDASTRRSKTAAGEAG